MTRCTPAEVDMDEAMARNGLARALMATDTLDGAEARSREVCGFSEIDYERAKAARLSPHRSSDRWDAIDVLARLDRFQKEAGARGATHTTFRRLTEVLGLAGSRREQLRRLLIGSRPDRYAAPLWRIGDAG